MIVLHMPDYLFVDFCLPLLYISYFTYLRKYMRLFNLNIDQFPFSLFFMNIFKDIEITTYYMNIACDMIMYIFLRLMPDNSKSL